MTKPPRKLRSSGPISGSPEPGKTPPPSGDEPGPAPLEDSDELGFFGPAAMVFDLEDEDGEGVGPNLLQPVQPGAASGPRPAQPGIEPTPAFDAAPTPEVSAALDPLQVTPLPPPLKASQTTAPDTTDPDAARFGLGAAIDAQAQAWAEFLALSSDGVASRPPPARKRRAPKRPAQAAPVVTPSPEAPLPGVASERPSDFDRYVMRFDEDEAEHREGVPTTVPSTPPVQKAPRAPRAPASDHERRSTRLKPAAPPVSPVPDAAPPSTTFDRYVMTFDEDEATAGPVRPPQLEETVSATAEQGRRRALFRAYPQMPALLVGAAAIAAATLVALTKDPTPAPAGSVGEVLAPLDQHALIGFAPDGRALLGRTLDSQHGTVSLRVDIVALTPGAEQWDFLVACPAAKVIYRSGDRWLDTGRTQPVGIANGVPVWQAQAAKFACLVKPLAGPWTGLSVAQDEAKLLIKENSDNKISESNN